MALKEKILSTVTTIVLVGLEMESPVDFDGDAARDRQKVDFHLRVRPEWNVKLAVTRYHFNSDSYTALSHAEKQQNTTSRSGRVANTAFTSRTAISAASRMG